MTTSYVITRDQIIVAALRKLGVIEPGDSISSGSIDQNIVDNAAMVLNLMVKQWATDGIKLWTVVEQVFPLTAGKNTYTIGPVGCDVTNNKPMKIVQGWLRNLSVTPNIDMPLNIASQHEYNTLGSKSSTGIANIVYLNPGVTTSTVKVYLTPDVITSTNYQVHLVVQVQIADINSSTDIPDFPNEWMNALVWGLADELAIEFSVPSNFRQELAMRAAKYQEQVSSASVAAESTSFVPNMRASYSSYM